MKMVDKMTRAMLSGGAMDMAAASYAYSRAHGLSVWEALSGACWCFWKYLPWKKP